MLTVRLWILVVPILAVSLLMSASSSQQPASPLADDCYVLDSADPGSMAGFLATNAELPAPESSMAPCVPGASGWPCCLRPCACQAAGCGGGGGGGGGW